MTARMPLIDRQLALTLTVATVNLFGEPLGGAPHVLQWRVGGGAAPLPKPRPSEVLALSGHAHVPPGALSWATRVRARLEFASQHRAMSRAALSPEATERLLDAWDAIPFVSGRAPLQGTGGFTAEFGTAVECYGLVDDRPFVLAYEVFPTQRLGGAAAGAWSRWVRALVDTKLVPLEFALDWGLPATITER